MAPIARLRDLSLELGGQRILSGLSLELTPGQLIGVVGPNGSGKTTLLRVIATLVTPTSGDGEVLGARLGSPDVYAIRSQIGLISHIPAVIPELTILENLTHIIKLAGADPGRAVRALEVVGLEGASDRQAERSSFGMLRRTEVARLLISRPRLLLLDEAISGLDDQARELIVALTRITLSAGGAAVMVSHDRAQIDQADKVFRIDRGNLEATS